MRRKRSRRVWRVSSVLLLTMMLGACGFHLRGQYTPTEWPAELKTLRVVVGGEEGLYDPLRLSVVNALTNQANVKVLTGLPKDEKGFATVVLDREVVHTEPLSVTPSNVKVSQVLILYGTGLTLYGSDGHKLMDTQLIRLRRHYQYDPSTVVAKRYEQDELVQVMREDATQQVVERLSAWRPTHADQR